MPRAQVAKADEQLERQGPANAQGPLRLTRGGPLVPQVLDNHGVINKAADWVERYRVLWEERFDRLDEYLKQLQKGEKRPGRSK